MKCLNCNNDIPDASTVCPFCNSKVEPMVAPMPVFNLESTSSLPVTPSAPVLPQDQDLDATATNISSSVDEEIQMPIMNTKNQVSPSIAPQESVGVVGQINATETSSQVNNQVLENGINPAVIDPLGEVMDGSKIGSSVAPVVKSKNKKKLIILLAILVVVLIIGGLGFAYYYTQYKTADKRVSAVFKGITAMTSNYKNETIDKASGTYDLDLNIDYNDEAIKAKIDGAYARDLSSGALDLTMNLESFIKGDELLNSPINVEFYYNDSKIYILLENFFDLYIYDEYDKLDAYFDAIEQNNISYITLINSLKTAVNSGLTNMISNQTVKDVTIHGVSSKVNVVSINFTARNQSLFDSAFYRVLANDSAFISEFAKLTGKEEELIKEQFNNATQDKEYNDLELALEIYTEMFGESFSGLKITTKENFINKLIRKDENEEVKVLELYPVTDGYGLTYKDGSQNVLEGTIEKTTKKTSTTNESTYKVYFTMYRDDIAYKVDASLNLIGDVNPKDAKVNVKNSINKIYLTEENKAAILEKYNHSGNISLHYPDILSKYLGLDVLANNLLPQDAVQESCMIVSACQTSNYEGYSICKNALDVDVICQDSWIVNGN